MISITVPVMGRMSYAMAEDQGKCPALEDPF